MYGHRRTAAPTILNLDQALKMYHDIKPIRGRSEDVRPFVKRSDDTRTIRLNADGTVSCRLYRTDVITFHEDWVRVDLAGYNTQSTAAFLCDVLPLSFCIFDHRIWVYCLSTDNLERGGYYPIPSGAPTYFVRDSQGAFTVLQNPKYPVVHQVDRKQANNVRKQYAAFKQYVINMFKLRDEVTPQEYGEVFGWINPDIPALPPRFEVREYIRIYNDELAAFMGLTQSQEPKDQYEAFLWLLTTQIGGLRTSWGARKVELKFALRTLNDLIMRHHRDQCFRSVERRDLKPCKDAYKAFF